MKVVYHERFTEVYTDDPAAAPGRMESIYDKLAGHFEFVRPEPATVEDLKLVHSDPHIKSIRQMGVNFGEIWVKFGCLTPVKGSVKLRNV